jgi:hypothetical protein
VGDRAGILERAVRAVAEQVHKAGDLIDEMYATGLPDGEGPVLAAKMLRADLLRVKGDLERELGRLVLDGERCGRRVHWSRAWEATLAIGVTRSRRQPTMRFRCGSSMRS